MLERRKHLKRERSDLKRKGGGQTLLQHIMKCSKNGFLNERSDDTSSLNQTKNIMKIIQTDTQTSLSVKIILTVE